MAKSDISGDFPTEPEGRQNWEWILAKSLLDANAHCTQAFEYYLLQTHWPDASSNLDSVEESIQAAIDEHETIVEHLELAADAVSELRDDDRA